MKAHRILVVDDETSSLEVFSLLLKTFLRNIEVVTCTSGEAALEQVRATPFDLVVLDVRMPGIDGFEVCRRLRANAATADLPIMMVSGMLTSSQHRVHGLDVGADAYLCKPFEPPEFIAQAKTLLRLKDSLDLLHQREHHLEEDLVARTGALRETEERFRHLFESSPDAVFVENEQGVILDVNPAACQLHGLSREALVGRSAFDLVPESSCAQVRAEFPRWFTGELTHLSGWSRHSDGTDIPVELRAGQLHYNGQPAILLHVRDISHRRQMEHRLSRLNECLCRLGADPIENIRSLLTIARELAGAAAVVYRRTDGELTLAEGVQAERLEALSAALGAGLPAHGSVVPLSALLGTADKAAGSTPPLESGIAQPVCWGEESIGLLYLLFSGPAVDGEADHKVYSILAASIAAEERRRRAEMDIRLAEQRYRALVEQLPAVAYIREVTPPSRMIFISPQIKDLLGYGVVSWIGPIEILVERLHPEDRAAVCVGMAERDRTHASFDIEYRLCAADGREVWFRDRGRYLEETPGRWSVHGVLLDISQQKVSERALEDSAAQLRQAQKMEAIGRLSGGVAHDFNNLLTSILGFTSIMEDDPELPDHLRGELAEVMRAGRRAEELVQQLLTFSHRQPAAAGVEDLNEVVREMDRLLRRTLGEDIELVTLTDDRPCLIRAQTGHLGQVVMNLAINARHAMPKGGKLTISTRRINGAAGWPDAAPPLKAPGYVRMDISDTGVGMTDEVREHAFEPFFTTREKGKGTGLGLATVYGIVTQYEGHIDLTTQIGVGTRFRVFIPALREDTARPATRHERAELPRGMETILLVEDEASVRRLAARHLTGLGYSIIEAGNGAEALQIFTQRAADIDLVLTDVVMPRMGGFELIRRIQELRPAVRVLVMTGFSPESPPDIARLAPSPIQKPFTRDRLATGVRAALDAPERTAP